MRILLIVCIFLISLPLPALATGPCESIAFGPVRQAVHWWHKLTSSQNRDQNNNTASTMTRLAGDKVTIPVEATPFKPGEVSLNPSSEHKGLAPFKQADQVVGIQTYLSALRQETRRLLNRDISELEELAIEQANRTGRVVDSKKSGWSLIREKVTILQKAGFSKQEIRHLIESGIVWTRAFTSKEMLIKNRRKGKEYLIIDRTEVAQVNAESDKAFVVEVEYLNRHGYYKVHLSQDKDFYAPTFKFTHPDTQILFESAKLKKRQVSREDIKLSPPTRKAEELRQKGYGPAWTKGIDQLNEWVEVRRQLQSLRANPYTTHIPYFADQIEAHLAFAKKEFSTMSEQRKTLLTNLKEKAKTAISNKEVTYEWWLNFNFELSIVLTNRTLNYQEQLIAKIIPHFPLRMAVPTTQGEMGIITLNLAQSEGIYPLGLISQPKAVNDTISSSFEFLQHDIQHTYHSISDIATNQYSTGHYLRHKKMQALMENLPTEKRKRAELIYFTVTHESNYDSLLSNTPREEIANRLAHSFHTGLIYEAFNEKMAGLGEEYSGIKDVNEQTQYIRNHIIEDFMREVHRPAF